MSPTSWRQLQSRPSNQRLPPKTVGGSSEPSSNEQRSDRGRFVFDASAFDRARLARVSHFRRNDVLKTDKERIVEELAAELGSAETLIVADYRGLTNKQLEALRDALIPHGARFRIVKNTLTRRAAEQAGADALLVMLEGPTAIAFIESSGDPAAVAKALAQTAKETNVLTLRGGILEGKTLSGAEVDRLATLPPAEVLRGQLVGAIVAPLMQLLALVSAPLRDLHGLIEARIAQLEEQGEVVEPAAEAAVAEPAAEEAAAEPEPAADEGPAADEPSAQADTPSDSVAAEPDDSEETEADAQSESEEEE
jgi:large subunit ribosomal protein L10